MQNTTYSLASLPIEIEYHMPIMDSTSSTIGLISTPTLTNTNPLSGLYAPQSFNFDHANNNCYPAQLAYEHYCAAATISYSMTTPNFVPFQFPKIYSSLTNNNLAKLEGENDTIKQKLHQQRHVDHTVNKISLANEYQQIICSDARYFPENSICTNPLYYSPSNVFEIEKFG